MTATLSPVLTAALEYARRGWYVLPCRIDGIAPNGKKIVVAVKQWQTVSSVDPGVIMAWFAPGSPWTGVAIDTGKSGLVVVDLDTTFGHDGLGDWAALGGTVASYAVRTPTGGLHLYFRADPARPVKGGAKDIAPGIDTRGTTGFVFAPPTSYVAGTYAETSANDWANLTLVPDIVAERAADRKRSGTSPLTGPMKVSTPPPVPGLATLSLPNVAGRFPRDEANRRIRDALDVVRGTPHGQGFNNALARASRELGSWVGGGHLTRDEAAMLLSWAVTQVFPGGPDGDDATTMDAGLDAGAASPFVVFTPAAQAVIDSSGAVDDDAFELEVTRQYVRLKALEEARNRLAAEKATGDGDGRVDWDLMDQPLPPVDWMVPGVLAAGRSYSLVGGAKAGKSTTARHLAVAAAEAGHGVLYLDRENTWQGDWLPQLKGMGVSKDIQRHLDVRCFPAIPPLDTEAGGEQLLSWVKATGARVVFIDMIMRFLAGPENDSDTISSFDRHTGQRLKAIGVTVIRLDHTGHEETGRARGTSGKAGDVDVQFILTRSGPVVSLDPGRISRHADQRTTVRLWVQDGRLVPYDDTEQVETQPDVLLVDLMQKMLDQGEVTLKTGQKTVITRLRERGQPVRQEHGVIAWREVLRANGAVMPEIHKKRPGPGDFTHLAVTREDDSG